MAVLDTSAIIDLSRGPSRPRGRAVEGVLQAIRLTGEMLWATRINLAELYVGIGLAPNPVLERQRLDGVLTDIGVLEFDDQSARSFASASIFLRRLGRPIGELDALIASIALAHGESIVTHNVTHFREVPGLRVLGY